MLVCDVMVEVDGGLVSSVFEIVVLVLLIMLIFGCVFDFVGRYMVVLFCDIINIWVFEFGWVFGFGIMCWMGLLFFLFGCNSISCRLVWFVYVLSIDMVVELVVVDFSVYLDCRLWFDGFIWVLILL